MLAADAALARFADRPITLVTLQASRALEGMLMRGFTTVRDAAGADGGLAEAVEMGLGSLKTSSARRRSVNAELLNHTGELGVVAPSARADLIAVDGSPLADTSLLDGQGEHFTHVMKDGMFYKRQ